MKKLAGIIWALTLMCSISTTSVFAASGRGHGTGTGHHKSDTSACAFVDANSDGICDTHAEHCQFVDANNDGSCDTHTEHCAFVDANNDGSCDTCLNGGTRPQDRTGRKDGCGRSNGCNRA